LPGFTERSDVRSRDNVEGFTERSDVRSRDNVEGFTERSDVRSRDNVEGFTERSDVRSRDNVEGFTGGGIVETLFQREFILYKLLHMDSREVEVGAGSRNKEYNSTCFGSMGLDSHPFDSHMIYSSIN
jgi:hypothetical protein